MDQAMQRSFHNPAPFRVDPATLPAAAQAVMAGNCAALAVYGGTSMTYLTLRGRLAGITVPTLALWGDSDRIVDRDYSRAYAAAIPGARFQLLTATGHLPLSAALTGRHVYRHPAYSCTPGSHDEEPARPASLAAQM